MRILNYWLLDQGDLVSRERGICRMERLLAIHHFRCHNYKCTGCFGKCHSSRGPLDMSTISGLGGLSVRGCCCILSLSSVRKQLTPWPLTVSSSTRDRRSRGWSVVQGNNYMHISPAHILSVIYLRATISDAICVALDDWLYHVRYNDNAD